MIPIVSAWSRPEVGGAKNGLGRRDGSLRRAQIVVYKRPQVGDTIELQESGGARKCGRSSDGEARAVRKTQGCRAVSLASFEAIDGNVAELLALDAVGKIFWQAFAPLEFQSAYPQILDPTTIQGWNVVLENGFL